MLGRTQQSTISPSILLARSDATRGCVQEYREASANPLSDPRNFFRDSSDREKTLLWKLRLAFQLDRQPKLNKRQVQVILDAISLSYPTFLTAFDNREEKASGEDSLRRRALAVFSRHELTELFANTVAGSNDEDLLTTYYDVSRLALRERKAYFKKAPSINKSDLWRTQLALTLIDHPELNEHQKEVILAAMSLATRDHFDIRPSNANWPAKVRALRALEQQIIIAFPFTQAAKIFATLGAEEETAKRPVDDSGSVWMSRVDYKIISDSGPYAKRTSSLLNMQDMELERSACQCSSESDWCHWGGYCRGGDCSPTQSGCGTLWSYPCNGASCG